VRFALSAATALRSASPHTGHDNTLVHAMGVNIGSDIAKLELTANGSSSGDAQTVATAATTAAAMAAAVAAGEAAARAQAAVDMVDRLSLSHTWHVLLVDDDALTLRTVEVLLRKFGYRVTTATSGREAIAHLEASRAPGSRPGQ
jgi:PleD family two-component response regulator